jgi:chorismate dehydratase
VRLGVIDYLNVVPVYDWLLRREREAGGLPGIETVAGVPAEMNRALLGGELDISNVSSFAFGEHARDWLLVPELSVAAHGRVESVLLFSWHEDWQALDGAAVALSGHSATSVELLRLLCERRHGISPSFSTYWPADLATMLDDMLERSEAALLIGDIALREGTLRREVAGRGRPFVFDLAAEWEAWTGLPFVFAVWAVRPGADLRGVDEALHEAKRQGLAHVGVIAFAESRRLGLDAGFCRRYLETLIRFDLGPRELAGLHRFYELAVAAGLAPAGRTIRFHRGAAALANV